MTQEEAGAHVKAVREYSTQLLLFVQPLLELLIDKTEREIAKALSTQYIFEYAVDSENKKA